MERLKALFRSCCGNEAAAVTPITGSGSNRQYFRLTGIDGHTLIGVIGTSKEENHAFIYLAQHFWHQQLPVPHVLAMTADGRCYLQNDLGSRSLFDALQAGREAGGCYSEAEVKLLRRTIALLPALQYKGAEGLDFNQCYPLATMDRQSILFDLNYFKYCFLKATGLDFHEVRLEEDAGQGPRGAGRGQAFSLPRLPGPQRHARRERESLLHRLPGRTARSRAVRPGQFPVAGLSTLSPGPARGTHQRLSPGPARIHRGQ